MAAVIITLKIMPSSPEVDLVVLEKLAKEKIVVFSDTKETKVEVTPIAFGLKAINITFVMDEAKGSTEKLEQDIAAIEDVNSVEVTDVRRALG